MSIKFGQFDVTKQVFYRAKHSFALVNIKPILPGHVLVCPYRSTGTLQDLNEEEISCLFRSVQLVQGVVQKVHNAPASNIAIQDGPAAGQSVPHLHVHIIPRRPADYANNDDIYPALEENEAGLRSDYARRATFPHVDDSARRTRSMSEMEEEARMLATYFEPGRL